MSAKPCSTGSLIHFRRRKIRPNATTLIGLEQLRARALLSAAEWEIPDLAENEVKRKEGWRIHYKKPGRCTVNTSDLMSRGVL
jgi:hypothetical protein